MVVPVLEGNLHGVAPFPTVPLTLNTHLLLYVLDCYHDAPPPLLCLILNLNLLFVCLTAISVIPTCVCLNLNLFDDLLLCVRLPAATVSA